MQRLTSQAGNVPGCIGVAVVERLDAPLVPQEHTGHGVFVTDFDGPLADCVLCMVRLLDTPCAIPVIAPLIMREICYWLQTGPHGREVAKVALANWSRSGW